MQINKCNKLVLITPDVISVMLRRPIEPIIIMDYKDIALHSAMSSNSKLIPPSIYDMLALLLKLRTNGFAIVTLKHIV